MFGKFKEMIGLGDFEEEFDEVDETLEEEEDEVEERVGDSASGIRK